MLFNIKQEYQKLIKEKEEELEKLDLELLQFRNKKRYTLINKQPRNLVTKFGVIKINRRIYKDNSNTIQKYVALLDNFLKLPKRKKIDPDLICEIEQQIGEGKRYQDILDMFPEASISKMTISRTFKHCSNDDIRNKVSKKVVLEPGKPLYIFMDDSFPPTRGVFFKCQKTQVRTISFCTGYDPKTLNKKRKVLFNKRTTFFIANEGKMIGTIDLAEKIMELGLTFYENFFDAKLIIGGDGASWIKILANHLNATYILDKFHAVKYFRDIWIRGQKKYDQYNWAMFKLACNHFENGNYNELINLLTIQKVPNHFINYFKANKLGIINQSHKDNIGVSAEIDVSRVVKSCLGYGSRLYNFLTFKHILNARVFKFNNM